MADQYVKNEALSTTSLWYAAFRMVEVLIAAGWTIHAMGNGSTRTGAGVDNWTGNFGGLGTGAWIVLNGPGGRQIMVQRSGTTTTSGYIRYSKAGDYDTSGTGSTPDNSATEQDVRGLKGSSSGFFGGYNITPTQMQMFAQDPTSGGSFVWVVQASGAPDSAGRFAFLELEGGESGDVDPYAFWTFGTPNGFWAGDLSNHQNFLAESALFRAWEADGSAFRAFGGGTLYCGWNSGSAQWGGSGGGVQVRGNSADDFDSAGDWRLWRIAPIDWNGSPPLSKGYTKHMGVVSSASGGTTGRTFGTGTYAKIGSYLWMPWNDDLTPPGTPP